MNLSLEDVLKEIDIKNDTLIKVINYADKFEEKLDKYLYKVDKSFIRNLYNVNRYNPSILRVINNSLEYGINVNDVDNKDKNVKWLC